MRENLYFLRHGQAYSNLYPSMLDDEYRNFLTPYGVLQAQLAAEYIHTQGIGLDLVYSSALLRARQTTAVILGKDQSSQGQHNWFISEDFNELRQEPRDRVFRGMHTVLDQWKHGNCLIVSHAWVMRVIWQDYLRLSLDSIDDALSVSSADPIPVINAQLYRYTDDKRIEKLNMRLTGGAVWE